MYAQILNNIHTGDNPVPVAKCDTCENAAIAVELLNKAIFLNNTKRQYTNAARAIAKAESIEGFVWTETI